MAVPAAYGQVVIDTNVLLSAALLPRSVPAQVVDRLLLDGILVFSAETFAELETRMWKPKFDRYLTIERRKGLLRDFSSSAHWVETDEELRRRRWSRNSSDDAFVRTALAAGVTRLISGDGDLLDLGAIGELRILTPAAALREIGGQ